MKQSDRARITALYARVSTEAQYEEGYSVDAQREMLEGYCKSRRIADYELYVDGGWSGSTLERPEMGRLIENVRSGRISAVVVYKLDRLSRSQKDTLYLIEDVFNPHGTDFVSLNENMDTSTPIGRAMLGIMSAFAQLERETIRERTRMGMKERVKSGLWMGGGHPPFGYDYDPSRGILVPNGDAETVRRIYDLYLQGFSMQRIAKAVGLPYERLARQILLRRTNAGYICYNGVEYKGAHEPIISEETYVRAMRMMDDRARRGQGGPRCLLAGLMYCGVCGAKLRYQKWGKSGYRVYCYSQDKGKPQLSKSGPCDNGRLRADELESVVVGDLFRMARLGPSDGSARSGGMESALESRVNALRRKLKRLYGLYSEAEDDALAGVISECRADLAEAEKRLAEEREAGVLSEERREKRERLNGIEEAWEYMTFHEKREILREFVEKIVVTYDRIDVYYRCEG